MKKPPIDIFLIEDTVPTSKLDSMFIDAFKRIGRKANYSQHIVSNAGSYTTALQALEKCENECVGVCDLHLEEKVRSIATPRFVGAGLDATLFKNAEHGVEALLALATKNAEKRYNTLIVVASTYCGPDRFNALKEHLRKYAPTVQLEQRGASLSNTHAAGTYIQQVAADWESYFGCLSARLRPTYAKSWFAPRPMEHDVQKHTWNGVKAAKNEAASRKLIVDYLGSALEASNALGLEMLKGLNHLEEFYEDVLRRICGACAMQTGCPGGKPLSRKAVAFVACAYAVDPVALIKRIPWDIDDPSSLLPRPSGNDSLDYAKAEELLYLLAGEPGKGGGLIPTLGIDERTKAKCITNVVLRKNNGARATLSVTFAIPGKILLGKWKEKTRQGSSIEKVWALKAFWDSNPPADGSDVNITGDAKCLTLTL